MADPTDEATGTAREAWAEGLSKKQVGLDLSQPAGAPFVSFVCGEDLLIDVTGSVIGTIKPVNANVAPPKHFTVKFAQKAGKQKPTKVEGAPVDVLATSVLGGPLVQSGLAGTDALYFVGPLQICAVVLLPLYSPGMAKDGHVEGKVRDGIDLFGLPGRWPETGLVHD